ncbi:hypothetical protein KNJ79_09530 [Sphingopyxis indica]|uniref:hypothetical protein n=1 Tax=Sphingopyxis indica TaxID=436663 RepID=UPI002938EF73|nr:hypothetical protein [Sphingopyxis indica]WOF45086.1 hypothetical protein KNJ79_09530 [Sphingopyxis indica]
MPDESRNLLAALLIDLANDAKRRSARSWDARKVFVAAYWATVAVHARHIARLLCRGARSRPARNPFRVVQRGFPELAAADWADASRLYCERRDTLDLGASMYPEGLLLIGETKVGRISYNGRIWQPGEWQADDAPLYDNRVAAGA